MNGNKVTESIIYVGVDDKEMDLFESQYVTPNGISYNSYVILDDKIAIMTCPAVIDGESQLAGVNDVFNAILVKGDATGDVVFYGKGAGKLPTASAVVSDIVIAAKEKSTTRMMSWEDSAQDFIIPVDRVENKFYVRAVADKEQVKQLFGEVRYLWRENAPENEIAFVTEIMNEKIFAEKCKEINVIGSIRVLPY